MLLIIWILLIMALFIVPIILIIKTTKRINKHMQIKEEYYQSEINKNNNSKE